MFIIIIKEIKLFFKVKYKKNIQLKLINTNIAYELNYCNRCYISQQIKFLFNFY